MKEHIRRINKRQVLITCQYCNVTLSNRPNFLSHIAVMHDKLERNHPCTECDRSFKTKSYLQKHTRKHKVVPQKNYQCSSCQKHFSTNSIFQTHLKTHTDEHPFFCQKSGIKLKLKYFLKVIQDYIVSQLFLVSIALNLTQRKEIGLVT